MSGTGTPVTVLGLGLMGRALAAAFVAAGHPTTVWNRTPGKAEGLGADVAASAGAAVAASPLVVVCVSDYPAVHELLREDGALLAGRVVVNLTTGTSAQARETAAWAARQGADYLDGAIMAIPPAVGTAEAVLLYSGPAAVFERHEAVLRVLGPDGTVYLDADPGLSALYDMALLGVMWGVLNAFLHGAALLGTAKVKAAAFAPLAVSMLGVVGGFVTAYAPQVDDGEYPADDATVTVHRDALAHLVHESEALGVHAELPRLLKALTDRAVADGHAGHSYAALIEQFRRP